MHYFWYVRTETRRMPSQTEGMKLAEGYSWDMKPSWGLRRGIKVWLCELKKRYGVCWWHLQCCMGLCDFSFRILDQVLGYVELGPKFYQFLFYKSLNGEFWWEFIYMTKDSRWQQINICVRIWRLSTLCDPCARLTPRSHEWLAAIFKTSTLRLTHGWSNIALTRLGNRNS
jgi:hypothetical protein